MNRKMNNEEMNMQEVTAKKNGGIKILYNKANLVVLIINIILAAGSAIFYKKKEESLSKKCKIGLIASVIVNGVLGLLNLFTVVDSNFTPLTEKEEKESDENIQESSEDDDFIDEDIESEE